MSLSVPEHVDTPSEAREPAGAPGAQPLASSARLAAAILAHELRGPLSVVLGYLGILERVDDEQARSHAIASAIRAAERMDAIIDDVLRSLDANPTGMPAPVERIRVREFVLGAVAELPPSNVTVEVLPGEDGTVEASGGQLARALSNVLGNAVKFSPAGGSVRVSIERRPDSVLIAVEDEGPGIPLAERERVFGPLERLPRDSGVPGTGLGLAICRDLVAAAGGSVGIRSGAGATGACVVIELPCAPGQD